MSEESGPDPISEFLDYAKVNEKMPDIPADENDPWWEICRRVFRQYRVQLPNKSPITTEELTSELEKLGTDFPWISQNSRSMQRLFVCYAA